jgi:hypothetical protein
MEIRSTSFNIDKNFRVRSYKHQANFRPKDQDIVCTKGFLTVEMTVAEWETLIPMVKAEIAKLRNQSKIDDIPEGEAAALAAGLM